MPRLFGPLEFVLAVGALGLVGFAFSNLFRNQRRYLSAFAALVAFPVSVWSASLARQTVYELRSDGVMSSQMDSCTLLFMPVFVVILTFVLVILADGYAALGLLENSQRRPEKVCIQTVFSRNVLVAIAVSVVVGGWFGFSTWGDWRINHPCL